MLLVIPVPSQDSGVSLIKFFQAPDPLITNSFNGLFKGTVRSD
jgi:hypothetical protein